MADELLIIRMLWLLPLKASLLAFLAVVLLFLATSPAQATRSGELNRERGSCASARRDSRRTGTLYPQRYAR
ncbi:hypothetical protein [Lelliottia amnigena]|uniref:hypothetical protein n=1 Tax=Lelliottia amnigena TaxID=61646 RepID=UPI001576EF3F